MVTGRIGVALAGLRDLLLTWLVRAGARPNVLTLYGLVASLAAAAFAAGGRFVPAGLLLLVAGILDALDGAIARRTNQTTPFGAFLDSVMDRYADLSLLLGLVLHYAATGQEGGTDRANLPLVLAAGTILGSALTPYARARAESLIETCQVGIVERPERLVLLVVGLLFDRMVPVLGILAVLTNVTVLQRLFYVRRVLTRKPLLRDADGRPLLSPLEHLLYWTYPRGSVAFDLLCAGLLVLLLAL